MKALELHLNTKVYLVFHHSAFKIRQRFSLLCLDLRKTAGRYFHSFFCILSFETNFGLFVVILKKSQERRNIQMFACSERQDKLGIFLLAAALCVVKYSRRSVHTFGWGWNLRNSKGKKRNSKNMRHI